MDRLHRLLRLARLRGDLVAIATIETAMATKPTVQKRRYWISDPSYADPHTLGVKWTESELRMAWGDR